jgi:hypothetical protein
MAEEAVRKEEKRSAREAERQLEVGSAPPAPAEVKEPNNNSWA